MTKKLWNVMLCLALVLGLLLAIPLISSEANSAEAQATTLEYTLTGVEFVTHEGDVWVITQGSMSWQLFDVLSSGGLQRAVYAVTGFSCEVVDPWGTAHTLTVVPDGLPSPYIYAGGIPDIVQDSGIVSVYSSGFLDMFITDISVDNQPVDQLDIIGGPAYTSSFWTGVFPTALSFLVESNAALPSLGFLDDFSLTGELSLLEVLVDIKPGSDPNSINLKSEGVIPVAILTTDEFDAAMVDPDTVLFAGAPPVRWAVEDVDGDGDMDMILHFKTQDTDIMPGDTEATLTGQTLDGIVISGFDSVMTVPQGP